MEILLTNDDGVTPLLRLLAGFLAQRGTLRVVVPKEEQSWKGKSITKFEPMRVEPLSLGGVEAFTFSGTPADCANFGIYHLYGDGKPDLVVSGINVGTNVGLSYTVSSGTVGACFEANIARLPGIALSQTLDKGVFNSWQTHRQIPEERMAMFRAQTDAVLARLWDRLLSRDGFFEDPVTWNVNMPVHLKDNWQLVPTYLGHAFYGSIFKKDGETYYHDVDSQGPDLRDGADTAVVNAGDVSVNRLDLLTLGQAIIEI